MSLRVRLALAFGLLVGALAGALVLVSGRYASDATSEQLGVYLTRLAIEFRDKLDAGLAERKDEVAMLARLDTAVPGAATPERRRARLDQLMRNRDFAWIGYVSGAGRVELASGGLLEGADVSARPWFRAASQGPVLLDVHEAELLAKLLPSTPEPRRFIDIALPIPGAQGVVGAHVDFFWAERLRSEIASYATDARPFDLLLAGADGTVLIGPKPLRGGRVPVRPGTRAGAPAGLERWPDGEEYLVGGATSASGLDWVVLARQRRADAFAPVARLQRAIFLASLLLALGAIGAGWFLANRIALPLEKRVRERTDELIEAQRQLEREIADTMQARDDVAEANERLALAMEASRLALWDYDVERDQVFLSSNWSQMLGGPAVETRITSGALVELVPEADRGRVIAAVQQVVKGAVPEYRIEHPVRRLDGGAIWIVSTGRVVARGADGRTLRILGTNRDITERVTATAALRASEARFKAAFDNPAVGVALVAPDGRFQATNRTMQAMLGYSESEMLATTFRALTHPEDLAENELLFREALEGRRNGYEYEKRFLRKDGTSLWVQVNVALDRDELDLPAQFVCQILDVTDRREAAAKIKELALHDALTGLPNKRLLSDRLDQALAIARRDRAGVGLLYFDLDGFKPVNDRLGHAAGDAVLVEVARRGRAVLRDSDTFARIGGDEFVVVLPRTGRETLEAAAQRLLATLSRPMQAAGQQVTIGASIGAILSPAGEETQDALMAGADAAMYEAKRAGRNCIRFQEQR